MAVASNIGIKNVGGRVGSYAVSTISFDSWMNEPVEQGAKRDKKSKASKEIINKIFADCALVINDPFWIAKFNSAAIGKFPRGFSYHDGLLIYRKGAKTKSIEVSSNPYEVAYASMEFFRTNGGIFSPLDQQNSLELQYKRYQTSGPREKLTWGTCNKKTHECMLSDYVLDIKGVMNLTNTQMEQLRQTIRLGISNKLFVKPNTAPVLIPEEVMRGFLLKAKWAR